MSIDTIENVFWRIKSAEPSSPIAVFRIPGGRQLDAMFANTVLTQDIIRNKDARLVGVFDGTMDQPEIRKLLQANI